MVTSDFRPEVVIRPFRACTMKNTQYNAYLWPNRRNSRILKEIGVEEHDGDVRFQTGSGSIALSFMRHASGHNYRNSSFINCGRGYGADITFHRTYFQLLLLLMSSPIGRNAYFCCSRYGVLLNDIAFVTKQLVRSRVRHAQSMDIIHTVLCLLELLHIRHGQPTALGVFVRVMIL